LGEAEINRLWRGGGEPLYILRVKQLQSKAFVPERSFLKLPGRERVDTKRMETHLSYLLHCFVIELYSQLMQEAVSIKGRRRLVKDAGTGGSGKIRNGSLLDVLTG
jgi:hypothetical protein